MKKLLALLLATSLLLVGCGKKENEPESPASETPSETEVDSEESNATSETSTPEGFKTIEDLPEQSETPREDDPFARFNDLQDVEPSQRKNLTGLGFTTQELVETINKCFDKTELTIRAAAPEYEDDDPSVALVAIDDLNMFVAIEDPDTHEVYGIISAGLGDGTDESGENVIYTILSIIQSVDSSLSEDDALLVVAELLSTEIPQKVVNNVVYGISMSEEYGTWLIVLPDVAPMETDSPDAE